MATADEKQAKQDALDASKQAVVQGQQRLQAEVGKAAGAFPVRRLRAAGDLSRYAVGGFLSDPNAQVGGGTKPPPTPGATGSGTGGGSGSGTAPPPKPPPGTLPPIGGSRPPSGGIVGEWRGGGGKSAGKAMGGGGAGTQPEWRAGGGKSAARPPVGSIGSATGSGYVNQTLSGGSARDLSSKELAYVNKAKGVTKSKPKPKASSGKRATAPKPKPKPRGKAVGTGKSNKTLRGGSARDYGNKELGAINRAKGAVQKKPKVKSKVKAGGGAARKAM